MRKKTTESKVSQQKFHLTYSKNYLTCPDQRTANTFGNRFAVTGNSDAVGDTKDDLFHECAGKVSINSSGSSSKAE